MFRHNWMCQTHVFPVSFLRESFSYILQKQVSQYHCRVTKRSCHIRFLGSVIKIAYYSARFMYEIENLKKIGLWYITNVLFNCIAIKFSQKIETSLYCWKATSCFSLCFPNDLLIERSSTFYIVFSNTEIVFSLKQSLKKWFVWHEGWNGKRELDVGQNGPACARPSRNLTCRWGF